MKLYTTPPNKKTVSRVRQEGDQGGTLKETVKLIWLESHQRFLLKRRRDSSFTTDQYGGKIAISFLGFYH